MKKISMLVFTLVLMVTLCAAAFAAEPVIKVQYDSEEKTFDNFEDGWNFAMEQANDEKVVYVTLLTDWIAEDRQFTDDFFNGPGFDYDTIYFANDVNITLDLGGHTINRGRIDSIANGEVMFINDNANVTIKNGTITGGYSSNGAGGIHIEGANVKLIDLVFTGNSVRNDDGAALQHVGGGELYMKNCRFVDNDCTNTGFDVYGTVYLNGVDKVLIEDCYFADNDDIDYGAGIYADECEDFVIKNSTFENLHADDRGGAIWVGGSIKDDPNGNAFTELYIYNCNFSNNSAGNYGGAIYSKMVELHVYDTEFKGNYSDWDGGAVYLTAGDLENGSVPSAFYRSTFDGNRAGWDGGAICCDSGMSIMTNATTYGCDFINNSAEENGGAVCTALDCRFGFFSDKETGKAGTMKNNSAGELGGGFYQGGNAPLHFGGEIYASGNVSSAGDDDIRIRYGSACKIMESITSPEGSIGIYYEDTNGGRLCRLEGENTTVDPKVFFINNGEFEIAQGHYNSQVDGDVKKIPTLDLIEKPARFGSIFGEGSLSTIIALLALIASGVSICMTVAQNKKKSAPATTEAEEE